MEELIDFLWGTNFHWFERIFLFKCMVQQFIWSCAFSRIDFIVFIRRAQLYLFYFACFILSCMRLLKPLPFPTWVPCSLLITHCFLDLFLVYFSLIFWTCYCWEILILVFFVSSLKNTPFHEMAIDYFCDDSDTFGGLSRDVSIGGFVLPGWFCC